MFIPQTTDDKNTLGVDKFNHYARPFSIYGHLSFFLGNSKVRKTFPDHPDSSALSRGFSRDKIKSLMAS